MCGGMNTEQAVYFHGINSICDFNIVNIGTILLNALEMYIIKRTVPIFRI